MLSESMVANQFLNDVTYRCKLRKSLLKSDGELAAQHEA